MGEHYNMNYIAVIIWICYYTYISSSHKIIDGDDLDPVYLNMYLDTDRAVFSNIVPLNKRSKRDINDKLLIHNSTNSIYLSCESSTTWVANKTTGITKEGKVVTLINEITHNKDVYKQYFLETRCAEYPSPVGCLGIDTRFWNSYCMPTHSFINSIVMENGTPKWEYIRIDTSCVCMVQLRCGDKQ
ncbi:NGF [Turkeypox virus]|uniref:NGF n=1 Tax=Turkeypox virus TaxID=336486 RepID=A0A0M5HR82_9POXV|nr:NGF [Turkeypox virus]ALA62421.1 NGF [Turkeypox virus]